LRKATIASVCPLGTSRLPLDGLCMKFDISTFFKTVEKIQFSFKSDKNNEYFM